jgi:signal transduction histidine kinase
LERLSADLVTNVVGNAFADAPPGGSVRVTARTAKAVATLAVADTGAGLYRVDLTAHPAGTGGGLTAASPGRGQGSTLTLTIAAAGFSRADGEPLAAPGPR